MGWRGGSVRPQYDGIGHHLTSSMHMVQLTSAEVYGNMSPAVWRHYNGNNNITRMRKFYGGSR